MFASVTLRKAVKLVGRQNAANEGVALFSIFIILYPLSQFPLQKTLLIRNIIDLLITGLLLRNMNFYEDCL